MSKYDFVNDIVKKAKIKQHYKDLAEKTGKITENVKKYGNKKELDKLRKTTKSKSKEEWDKLSDKEKKIVTHTGAATTGASVASLQKDGQVNKVKEDVEKDKLSKDALIEELENILRN